MSHIDLPRPYTLIDPPFSAGRTLLSRAFAHLSALEWGLSEEEIEAAFDAPRASGDADSVHSLSRLLGGLFGEGRVDTFARPFGGGAATAIAASLWEIDDFSPRFSTSAMALGNPFDRTAPPTHWIFVDTPAFQTVVDAMFGEYAPASRIDRAPDAAAPIEATSTRPPEKFLRMPELLRRVGLSRSTIYERARAGSFPKGVPLGENSTGWRESDVEEWMARRG